MYNKVILAGRLVRDPEMKYLQDGKAVTSFTIAVDRGFKKDGDSQADFIKITTWGNTAEFVGKYITRGRLVLVDGSIRTGSYEKEGKKVYTTEVQAMTVKALDKGTDVANNETTDEVEDIFSAPF